MSYELRNYHTEHGNKTVILDSNGRKWCHVLMMDGGLIVKKVPTEDRRFMREVIQHGRTKSMKTVLRQFRKYGRRTGMSKAAKTFLTKATKAA